MIQSFRSLLGDTPDRESLRAAVTVLPSPPKAPPGHPDYETEFLASAEHWFFPDEPHLDALVGAHSTGRIALAGRDYLVPSERGALYAKPSGREGFFLLTGTPGVGKSLIAAALDSTFGRPITLEPISVPGAIHPITFVPVVRVRVKGMTESQILHGLIEALYEAAGKPRHVKLPKPTATLPELRASLTAAIVRYAVCLLIIDEAQGTRLGARLWSAIDALSTLPCALVVVTNYDPIFTWLSDAVSARRVGRLGRHDIQGFIVDGPAYQSHIESLLTIAPYGVKPEDQDSLIKSIKHLCWGVPEPTNRLAISLMVLSGQLRQPLSMKLLDAAVQTEGVKADLRIATALREGNLSKLRNLTSPFADTSDKYKVSTLYRGLLLAAWRRAKPDDSVPAPRAPKRAAPEDAPPGKEQRFLRRSNASRWGM